MNIGGLHLEKPLMNASGTLSRENLDEVKELYGAAITKTVTLEPREGNPPPRIAEVPGGMINNIGLQNVGIDRFLQEELGEWDVGLPIIVSIQESTRFALSEMCKMLSYDDYAAKVSAVELNLSCPNIDQSPVRPKTVRRVVKRCRKSLRGKPIIVKLANERVLSNAIAAKDAGADALTLINSIPSMVYINGKPFRGGQSGPGIKGIALRAVDEVSRVVDIPLIGCGGITCDKDIEDFMRAGAPAVQIGSASFSREPREIAGKFGVVIPESTERKQMRVSDLQVRSYVLTEHASIEWRGDTGWAITDGFGNVMNHEGMWEWEPNPSTRDTPFVRRTRYDTAEEALSHYLAWCELP